MCDNVMQLCTVYFKRARLELKCGTGLKMVGFHTF